MSTVIRFWIVQSVPTQGDFDHLHYTRFDDLAQARQEARNLAIQHMGREFAVLETVEAYRSYPIQVERLSIDSLPKAGGET